MMTDEEGAAKLRQADATGDRRLVLGVLGLVGKNVQLVPGGVPPLTLAEGRRLREKYQFTMDEMVLGRNRPA